MNQESVKPNNRKRVKTLVLILIIAVILLILWFSLIEPGIFSSRMLIEIYPSNAHNRGIGHTNDEYVPGISVQNVEGEKAVALLREVHYDRTFRSQPVDWSCNTKYIPDSYKTNDPDEVKYVVYVNKYRNKVGEYENNASAARVDYFVAVIDRTTGEALVSEVFIGGAPPSSISSNQGVGIGSKPSESNIISWVESVLP
ncbi:hypothetical protein LJC56_08650 [Christensenellaceae bacterium OttesenSCG-928-K19]|nr:hypothetical protein [Christensenellaceae bacterium OttesenSCG-928-K19]